MKKMSTVQICDTTLRDGTQGMGVSFSTAAKLRLVRRLDDIGVHFIEGGYPGAGEKDMEFFREAMKMRLVNSQVVAFGSTRRVKSNVAQDDNVRKLLE
ncbi:MAG: citramalate synthase, partial [bacterium]